MQAVFVRGKLSFCCPHLLASRWGRPAFIFCFWLPPSISSVVSDLHWHYDIVFILIYCGECSRGRSTLRHGDISSRFNQFCVLSLIIMRVIRAWRWAAHPAVPRGAALCVRDQGPQHGQQGGVQRGGDQGHAPAGQGDRQESGWEEKCMILRVNHDPVFVGIPAPDKAFSIDIEGKTYNLK